MYQKITKARDFFLVPTLKLKRARFQNENVLAAIGNGIFASFQVVFVNTGITESTTYGRGAFSSVKAEAIRTGAHLGLLAESGAQRGHAGLEEATRQWKSQLDQSLVEW